MHRAEYEAVGKFQKTIVAERIVNMIRESLGRFLKWEKDKGWVEVDDEAAREKISHFFRHLRSKTSATEQTLGDQPVSTSKRVTPCPSPIQYSEETIGSKSVKHKIHAPEDCDAPAEDAGEDLGVL